MTAETSGPAETLRTNLMLIASGYASATRTSLAYVSKRFYGKTKFLEDFRKGRCSISIDKYETLVAALRAEWPKQRPWPFLRPVVIDKPAARNPNVAKSILTLEGRGQHSR